MAKINKIVVHGGRAHRDDFISVALAIAVARRADGMVPQVYRRNPTLEEIDDPGVLVLDVGGVYDPARSCFDHHQRGRDETPECALSLWAPHVMFDRVNLATILDTSTWFRTTVAMDVLGPYAVAAELGISTDKLFSVLSPLEAVLLEQFETSTRRDGLVAPDYADTVLWALGIELLLGLIAEHRGVERMRAVRQVHHVLGVSLGVEVSVVDEDSIEGMDALRRAEGRECGVVCWHDDRGPGWACLRYDDDPRVDFATLAANGHVLFAHPGGFILKTRERLVISELLALVGLAIKD
jgi:hypothetical protein